MDNVLKNIRKFRDIKGLTQAQMAQKLNIEQPSYAHIESGKRKLSLERLLQIGIILDVPIDELLKENPDFTKPDLPLKGVEESKQAEYLRESVMMEKKLLLSEVESLKQKVELLQQTISDKEKIIKLLESKT